MWSSTGKAQLERCDQIQIKLTRKMWSSTDKGQLKRCDQIPIKGN